VCGLFTRPPSFTPRPDCGSQRVSFESLAEPAPIVGLTCFISLFQRRIGRHDLARHQPVEQHPDGPGYEDVSVSLIKDSRIREGLNLQFRAEFFNLLNHTNFDLPDLFLGSPTFGRISSAESPRRIQFGLKLLL